MVGPRRFAVLALLPLLLAGLAACGGDDDDDDDTSADVTTTVADDTDDTTEDTEPGAEGEYTITATDYEFDVPDEITGGVVTITLENEGEHAHEAAFIKVDRELDADAFATEFGPVLEGGPISDNFEAVSGVGEVEGGSELTSTITLPRGTWALFCTLTDEPGEEAAGESELEEPPPHFQLGMYEQIVVHKGDEGAELPESDATITATDYTFDWDVEAGDKTVTFRNESEAQWHHAVLMAFEEGVDEQAALDAVTVFLSSDESGEPPPEGTPEPEELPGSFVFSEGQGGTFEIPDGFESGRVYVALCFLSDKEGGAPHAIAHDMVSAHTVE
jgi:hypothetical protein